MLPQHSFQCHLQPNIVLIQIRIQFLRPQDLRDLFQLIIIIGAFEEGLPVENLTYKKSTIPAIITPNDQMSSE